MKLKTMFRSLFFFWLIAFFIYPHQSQAQRALPRGVNVKFEPILGFETLYRSSPTSHTVSRMTYGLRVIAGVPVIAAELEYTQGSDTETYSTAPEKIKYEDQKLKLGVRTTYNFAKIMNFVARLGGQATQTTISTTNSGITTEEKESIKYDPYAGGAFGLYLGQSATLNIGTTVVFRDTNDMKKNEYQTVISLGVGI